MADALAAQIGLERCDLFGAARFGVDPADEVVLLQRRRRVGGLRAGENQQPKSARDKRDPGV